MPLESWTRTQMAPRWGTLQREPDAFFDSIVEMMCSSLDAPISMISIIQNNYHFVRASHGLPALVRADGELPISHSICQHVVGMGRPLVVADAMAHPLVRNNPSVAEDNIAAYLGEPLHAANGVPCGTLCVLDTRPRDWREKERRMISITAMIVEKALGWPDGVQDFPVN